MNDAVTKRLHDVQLEILDEFVRICEKHNLTYYLMGGTLLGAVRHKGFIPWDDDVDTAMPRADYEKFIDLCATELPGQYYLQCYRTDDDYWQLFAKVQKRNTLFLEKWSPKDFLDKQGIFIDIFPLDDAKKPTGFQATQKKWLKTLYAAMRVRKGEWKPGPPTFVLSHLYNNKQLQALQQKVMQMDNGKGYGYYVNFGSQYGVVKQTIRKEIFDPPVKVEFEGRSMNSLHDADHYFRRIFGGDYMTPPPPEKRGSHMLERLSFDLSGPDVDLNG